MLHFYLLVTIICGFIFLLGIAVGHSILVLKIRKEENKKRELELALIEKRERVLKESKKISSNLEELLYKVHVQQEIDNIIRNKDIR